MPLASKNVVRTLLFITTVLITVINVYGSEEKRLNLKIGFDLVSGPNGVPSLRIRDFEESQEPNARANEGNKNAQTTPGEIDTWADSFSDSKEQEHTTTTAGDIKSNEAAKSDDDDTDNSSEEENGKISTRGLRAEEYEPEEHPKSIHKQQDSENDSDNEDRRHKRHALFDTFVKRQSRKWRKFL